MVSLFDASQAPSVMGGNGPAELEFNDEEKKAFDKFVGGLANDGKDTYAIYNPSTGKHTGRYKSKTPYGAALKAARRLFSKTSRKTKRGGAEGDAPAAETPTVEAPATEEAFSTGGAKRSAAMKGSFKPGSETKKFMLIKITRGSPHDIYHYTAELKTYTRPLVVMRGGVKVEIKHKVFVTRTELPSAQKAMMVAKKDAAKAKKVAAVRKAKKALNKDKAEAKKEAAKAKKAEAKARKEAKKEAAKAKKAAAKAKKAASKKTTSAKKPKARKTKKMMGGCGSGTCNMFY